MTRALAWLALAIIVWLFQPFNLIGYNCFTAWRVFGYPVPMLAIEEDHLPQCEKIERIP